MCIGQRVQCLLMFLLLLRFNVTWVVLDRFRKILKYETFIKNSVQWESSCSMRADGETDMTKLIIAFRNFENAPKTHTMEIHKNGTHTHIYIHIYIYIYTRIHSDGGKQWQPTPKSLPRMQCARAIPVA
jgi:hypothetical protein